VKLALVSVRPALSGCAVTALQLQDYAISTAIRVVASMLVNSFLASTGGQGKPHLPGYQGGGRTE
jgi:hypothetical protein